MDRKWWLGLLVAGSLAGAAAAVWISGIRPFRSPSDPGLMKALAPQPATVNRIHAAPPTGCTPFYQALFTEDFSSIAADHMNHLPSSNGCVGKSDMEKGVIAKYEEVCRVGVAYPAAYEQWGPAQKDRASACLLWVWFLRSSVVAQQLAPTNPKDVSDPSILAQWLFGNFMASHFDHTSPIAERLLEVDPTSQLGARALMAKSLEELSEFSTKGETDKAPAALWQRADREWRRANRLAPNNMETELAGILVRTKNMDLPLLKSELAARKTKNDFLGTYLDAYYVYKTQSKEAAIPLLEAAAVKFPKEAPMLQRVAETCRKERKCAFEMSYRMDMNNKIRVDDIIH